MTKLFSSAVETCRRGDVENVTVDGWPVLAAMRIPGMAKVTMNLILSHDHEAHTNITLIHVSDMSFI